MEGERGRERNECVSRKDRPLISLKETHSHTKNTHKHTHECSQDKVLNSGLSEQPVARPSTHAALTFLSQNNIVPHHKENIIPGL